MNQNAYNGWTNYETWNAALWLDNDQGLQEMVNEYAQNAYDGTFGDDTFTHEEQAAFALADTIKEMFETDTTEAFDNYSPAGWMRDAVNSYLGEVNWYEIAQHFIEDVEKEEA